MHLLLFSSCTRTLSLILSLLPHAPKVDPGSATWNALAKTNALDIRLYEFLLGLFDEQKETIESYASSYA